MGESAEFEKLTMLEGRLAAALDRIGAGLGALQAGQSMPLIDPSDTSAAMEDALARADAAETERAALVEQVAALEGRLAETTEALAKAEAVADGKETTASDADLARLTEERDGLAQRVQALEAARTADADETKRALSSRDDEISALREQLKGAKSGAAAGSGSPDADDDAEDDSLADTVSLLTVRLKRLRRQNHTAMAERDDAKAVIEELGHSADDIDARILALRSEIIRLRLTNDDLLQSVDAVGKSANVAVADVIEALISEIEALKTARASEAAEIARILADLEPAVAEGGANA